MQLGPHERPESEEVTKHLRKGVHWVHIAGQHGKRKVRVDSKGKWHFHEGDTRWQVPYVSQEAVRTWHAGDTARDAGPTGYTSGRQAARLERA